MTLDQHITAAQDTLRAAAARAGQKLVIAYSAGKDSIVAAHLAKATLGTTAAICDSSFWFVRHLADAQRSAQQLGLEVTYHDRFGWRFLQTHPDWLFRPEASQSELFGRRQQATVKGHARSVGYAGVIYGRRTQENMVPSACYQTREGLWQIHPLRDWKHEHVWAYIERHQLHVPAIYQEEIGQKDGSTPAIFLAPEKYALPVEELIRRFCPETYELMHYHNLFTLYRQHNGRSS